MNAMALSMALHNLVSTWWPVIISGLRDAGGGVPLNITGFWDAPSNKLYTLELLRVIVRPSVRFRKFRGESTKII